MFVTLVHPVRGEVRVVGSPLKFSDTPVIYPKAPPLVGEDTEAILKERLTLTDQDIQGLREKKIV